MIIVEKIKDSELDDLSLLYRELVGRESIIYKMKKIFNLIDDNINYYLLGVKVNGRIVGSAMVIINYDLVGECLPFMVIENVVVGEKFQRKGYGTLLFNKIEEIALKRSCYYIMFLSNVKRVSSHEFYKKLGYKNNENLAFKKYLK